jgi:hypothetical protein
MMTFKEKYIAYHRIRSEDFIDHLFNRSLYRHALLVAWLVNQFEPQVFSPDYDLISDCGDLKRRRDFSDLISPWVTHPHNGGFLRKIGHVRVSITRLRAEMSLVMSRSENPRSKHDSELDVATKSAVVSDS